ncbi:hypothetical protein GEMRC1_000255 [Eukaryota sp. GEM-RC1]
MRDFVAWNMTGRYLGLLVKPHYSFSHRGLMIKIRDEVLIDVIVAKSFSKILEMMGLSYERYQEGFNNYEEVFDWIKESPQFDSHLILNHNERRLKHSWAGFNAFAKSHHKLGKPLEPIDLTEIRKLAPNHHKLITVDLEEIDMY